MGNTGTKDGPGVLKATRVGGDEEFDRLAAALQGQLHSLASAVHSRIRDKYRLAEANAEGSAGQVAEFFRESIRVQMQSFRAGALPNRCPEVDSTAPAALDGAAGLRILLDGYHLCQATLWRAWFALVEDSIEARAPQRRELLARGSDYFFRYADLLSGYVTEAYQLQVVQSGDSGEQRRFRAIKELLDGDPLAASWFDLDLDRHHLALIAWGEDPAGTARRLATDLGRPLLLVATPGVQSGCWGWISGTRPLQGTEEHRIASFEPTAAGLALGLEGFGEAGFCSSHRQALRAQRFAPQDEVALHRYEDVVVEALACENEDDARAFVAHELRGIEDDSAVSCRLRETLAAYFAAEYNAASAGARLGVHQQTVANRLRAAEERLGHTSIGLRRVELEVALRLRECLPAAPR